MFSEALKLWIYEDFLAGMRSQLLSLSVLGWIPCVGDVSGKHGPVLGVWFDMVKQDTMHCCFLPLCFFTNILFSCSKTIYLCNIPYCIKPSQILELHSLFIAVLCVLGELRSNKIYFDLKREIKFSLTSLLTYYKTFHWYSEVLYESLMQDFRL